MWYDARDIGLSVVIFEHDGSFCAGVGKTLSTRVQVTICPGEMMDFDDGVFLAYRTTVYFQWGLLKNDPYTKTYSDWSWKW